ncbi:hypothetical protein E8E12_007379 [Didymella heteroderae]|uniref:Alpha/beta hydrolase fold-3 domain-containing protein n=1 Tax=Didymella heteroderae TaxID=1769908 RepID=A0A9P4WP83_9PLEO|nr:hypothetical protein E8E12_007379 [Didymella heteroderae]
MSKSSVYLDPLNQAFAEAAAALPPLQDLTVEQFRAEVEKLQQHNPIPGVTRTEFIVDFEDGVTTYIFRPDVVFPEYTLAPEARYPTQQEQCYAVVKWVRTQGNTHGLSQDLLAVAGDSAGAQLAIAVSILASTRKPIVPISYQVLISPVTDTVTTDRDTPSEFKYFNGPFLTVPFLRKSIDEYIPDPDDRVSELATPRNISSKNAAKQPPTMICNAAVDPLRDDGILFGEILQRAGVDVSIATFHGQLHDSVLLEAVRQGATPKAEVRLIAAQIKRALIESGDTNGAGKKRRQRAGVEANRNADKRTKRKLR